MKEFTKKLIGRLEEEKKLNPCRNTQCKVCKYTNNCWEGEMSFKVEIDNVVEIVNELAEEYKGGWIPVSERLPERNKCVLCYAKSTARGGDTLFVGSCDNGFWFLQTSIGTLGYPTQYEVIAWQPLPEAYKGE